MVLEQSRYAGAIRADADRMAAAIERGPADAPVVACPGWDLARLALHMGMIHRWATVAVRTGRHEELPDPDHVDDWPAWLREGAATLADAIEAVPADAPTWHPFPIEQQQWVWARRQAQETAMHRRDAEAAVGDPSPLDPELASDGLDEYVTMSIPRLVVRTGVDLPRSSLHVHCTDVDGEWLVWNDDDGYHVIAEHRKGDAALRGTAEQLLLVVMGRGDRASLDVVGDADVADAWLGLPGW